MNTIIKQVDGFKLYKFLNEVYTVHGNMESKTNFVEKPAAGAARIWILYRSPP